MMDVMTTTAIGNEGEGTAADFLERKGFEIVARNWRTRCCEIDLVVRKCRRLGRKKNCRIHIVEVKFRKSNQFGRPEEYVSMDKRKRLIRAAQHWAHEHEWAGDYQIDVISIDGYAGTVAYIPNITG
jgi:putative endonuclease